MNYIILDWAGNDVFRGKTFKNFDDADLFLNQFICNTYSDTIENDDRYNEEYNEYWILEK